ncbi:MAG: glycosyltransferase family 8 protein [Paracoccaceae bacterium]
MSTALVYVSDSQFLGPTLLSARSFENLVGDADIIVFVTDASDNLLDSVQSWLNKSGSSVMVRSANMTTGSGFRILDHLTPASFGRLQMHQWLSSDYERVIYLDGDTLSGPIAIDFNVSLDGQMVGAVDDLAIVEKGEAGALRAGLGLEAAGRYFNSGVLVIDWAQWLQAETGERAIRFLEQHPELPFGDQCALNRVCDEAWKPIDVSWNCQSPVMELEMIRSAARIFHFTGARKPWHLDKWRGPGTFSTFYRDGLPEIPGPCVLRADTIKSKGSRFLRPIGRKLSGKREFGWADWLAKTGMRPASQPQRRQG